MEELRILARLNEETQVHHADADSDVDRYLFCSNVSSADYRTYLQRVYGFLVPLEAALATAPDLDTVIDAKGRAKSALVAHDLFALGMTMDEVSALPHCTRIPAFRGPAAALGWMYIAERPLLASAVIRGHLASYLPTEMATASAYLMCYAGQVGAMWRELGLAMQQVAGSPAVADRIVVAAHDAFRTLHRWRTQELGRASVIRYAG
ncbi:MAG TPA: biliverdin-producing heme oxygenase [Kofleriaceae bacterium]|nr:biliverdin-producing heme oxygenase [Kofleriaceae bacterium]